MKKFLFLSLTIILLFVSCAKQNNEITVYAYDSFCSSWGPGESLAKEFEEQTGIHVNLVSCGSGVELYSKLIFEGEKCKADVVIGLPDSIKTETSLFYSWHPSCIENLNLNSGFSNIYPFDYGIFSFVFNSEDTSVSVPSSLSDLLKPQYKDKFILIDPRTSSVGLGLFIWTIESFGLDGALNWWKGAEENALTTASSWSQAYGLFTEGEAPLVISYTTSPVYHKEYENTDHIIALEFTEPAIGTTEYLGICKASADKDSAKAFCEFILTEGQSKIAIANTMFPANETTVLPTSYSVALRPEVVKKLNLTDYADKIDGYLNLLSEAISR